MTDPITRMAAREIEERYHEYPKAASGMLAALKKARAEESCSPIIAYILDKAIAQAEAAGIKAHS